MYRWELTRAALAQRVLAIVRAGSAEEATATARTLLDAGITSLEISFTTPGAAGALAALRREAGEGTVLGAGTVLDAATARSALDAGARFLVCPSLEPEVIQAGHRYGVPVFAGVATPTEAVRALELGADALKLFPAASLGIDWLRELRGPLPQAPLVPTGGITPERAPEWIAAGAVACGMGASLAEGDEATVRARVTGLLRRLAEAAPDAV